MKKVLIVLVNLVVPGSGQVVVGRPGWGVVTAAVFGCSVGAALLGSAVVPGILSGRAILGLILVAAATWTASQAALVLRLRRNEQQERHSRSQALEQVARLWLSGERSKALAVTEALLERWPSESVLYFVAARMWAEGSEPDAARHSRRLLALCEACDLGGRWRGTVARERERMRGNRPEAAA